MIKGFKEYGEEIARYLVGVGILFFLGGLIRNLFFTCDQLNLAEFGDFIGGTAGSAWLLASVLFFYESLTSQKKELQETRKVMKNQREEFEVNRITNIVYKQTEIYNRFLDQIHWSPESSDLGKNIHGLLSIISYSKYWDQKKEQLTKKASFNNIQNIDLLSKLSQFEANVNFLNRLSILQSDLEYFNKIIFSANLEDDYKIDLKLLIKKNYLMKHLQSLLTTFQEKTNYLSLIDLDKSVEKLEEKLVKAKEKFTKGLTKNKTNANYKTYSTDAQEVKKLEEKIEEVRFQIKTYIDSSSEIAKQMNEISKLIPQYNG